MIDLGLWPLVYWLFKLIPNPPIETKRTELPFALNTSINLTAIPVALLLILGLVFHA